MFDGPEGFPFIDRSATDSELILTLIAASIFLVAIIT